MELSELRKIRSRVEQLRSESDRAAGALAEHMRRLKDEFDCDTVEQGEDLLRRIQADTTAAEKKLGKMVKDFEKKWKDML